MCQVLGDIHKTTAQAARIHFLQADHIVIGQHGGYTVEIPQPLTMGQHMLPALGNVFPVALGIDPGLDVVAQNTETTGQFVP